MSYLVFDIAILAALGLFAVRGAQRGVVLTLCGMAAVFVAFFGASFLSNLMCAPVGRLIQPPVEAVVREILRDAVDETKWLLELPAQALDGAAEEAGLPQLPVEQALAALEGTPFYRTFGDSLEEAVEAGTVKLTTTAAAAIAGYVARETARLVLFLVGFVVVLLAWVLLAHALDLAFRLPVLNSVNRWAGGAVGLLKGVLVVFILCWLFKGSVIPRQAIEESVLLRFFCENSPLRLLSHTVSAAKALS